MSKPISLIQKFRNLMAPPKEINHRRIPNEYTKEELEHFAENVKKGIGLPPLAEGEKRFPNLPAGFCDTCNYLCYKEDKEPYMMQ